MKIKRLSLYSGDLGSQKRFYTGLLDLELIDESDDSFSIRVGDSILTFKKGQGHPYYHFAINIPSNQIMEAIAWTKDKVDLQLMEGKEIADFSSWNAEAIYFYDADRNIVEFIARKNLDITLNTSFSHGSLLHISEIGLPTSDVKRMYEILHARFGLEKYDGDFERFCVIGSETGLFITVNYNQKTWIPNMDEAIPFPFDAVIENEEGKEFGLIYKDEEIRIVD